MIKGTRSGKTQGRTLKALKTVQYGSTYQEESESAYGHAWKTAGNKAGEIDKVPVKKNFPRHAKEYNIKGFKLGVTGSDWIPKRTPYCCLPHTTPILNSPHTIVSSRTVVHSFSTTIWRLLNQSGSETTSAAERIEWI